jgi:hypothetical protein
MTPLKQLLAEEGTDSIFKKGDTDGDNTISLVRTSDRPPSALKGLALVVRNAMCISCVLGDVRQLLNSCSCTAHSSLAKWVLNGLQGIPAR